MYKSPHAYMIVNIRVCAKRSSVAESKSVLFTSNAVRSCERVSCIYAIKKNLQTQCIRTFYTFLKAISLQYSERRPIETDENWHGKRKIWAWTANHYITASPTPKVAAETQDTQYFMYATCYIRRAIEQYSVYIAAASRAFLCS